MGIDIVGWAHTRFGRLEGQGLEELIVGVARDAIDDAGIGADGVGGIWIGNFNAGFDPAGFCSSLALGADDALRWAPATRVENACASGAAALYSACDAVEAGRVDIALVIGAEKMTAVSGAEVTRILASASYYPEEGALGMTFPGIFGRIAEQYFARYGDHSADLARIAAKNHLNGTRNPYAHMRKDLGFAFCNSSGEHNPRIAGPLRKTDCSLVSDGAAALVIARDDVHGVGRRRIRVRARAQVNDFLPMSRRQLIEFEGPRRAWASAFRLGSCTVDDLSFAEVHDCFTIAELLAYEAMGLAEGGRGHTCLEDGSVYPDGRLPVNPSGGLKAKGHPVGATGVSMHVMAAMQLAGEAGEMQVAGAELGGVFNMGGAAVASYVTLLERCA